MPEKGITDWGPPRAIGLYSNYECKLQDLTLVAYFYPLKNAVQLVDFKFLEKHLPEPYLGIKGLLQIPYKSWSEIYPMVLETTETKSTPDYLWNYVVGRGNMRPGDIAFKLNGDWIKVEDAIQVADITKDTEIWPSLEYNMYRRPDLATDKTVTDLTDLKYDASRGLGVHAKRDTPLNVEVLPRVRAGVAETPLGKPPKAEPWLPTLGEFYPKPMPKPKKMGRPIIEKEQLPKSMIQAAKQQTDLLTQLNEQNKNIVDILKEQEDKLQTMIDTNDPAANDPRARKRREEEQNLLCLTFLNQNYQIITALRSQRAQLGGPEPTIVEPDLLAQIEQEISSMARDITKADQEEAIQEEAILENTEEQRAIEDLCGGLRTFIGQKADLEQGQGITDAINPEDPTMAMKEEISSDLENSNGEANSGGIELANPEDPQGQNEIKDAETLVDSPSYRYETFDSEERGGGAAK
ncbi:hypothetical protein ABW19_dt0209341 [Dactylella cylindrospora]|nr:hypothetical protein ABW19_dt0209341 [Dactylella cylindrospora]